VNFGLTENGGPEEGGSKKKNSRTGKKNFQQIVGLGHVKAEQMKK